MTFGASTFLAAAGAILRYAVADQVDDVDLRTIGLILVVAGAVGLVIGLVQLSTRSPLVIEVRGVREVPPGS